jgi:ureidoglycolate hydrolase
MQTIEKYYHSGAGYNPFVIRDGWQVAQLNYAPELSFQAMHRLERHVATDEVFILLKGRSVLITASQDAGGPRVETCAMQPGVTHNIPAGIWHAIAMQPEDVVFIVENPYTHRDDVEYRDLSPQESECLADCLAAECG